MRPSLKRYLRMLFLAAGALGLMLGGVTCTTSPKLAAGVVKRSGSVDCEGTAVAVDFYFRADGVKRPGVVVTHGFMRSKRYMAGWGAALAERGMVAAVVTQPYVAKHLRNAKAIEAVVAAGRRQEWPVAVDGRMGLMGFSMGGLTTLLAASRMEEPVAAWVGLDPVDFEGKGAAVAGRVKAAGLALLAEPAPFNLEGNALSMLADYGGEVTMWKVVGATHCDPESPTDWLGQLACGKVDERRQRLFRETALDFLEGALLGAPVVKWGAELPEGMVRVSVKR
jgi:dienelactone hydrolase